MFLLFNLLPIYQDNNPTEVIINSIDTYYNKLLISLPRIALAIFIIVAGILISKLITNFYKRRFLKQAEDP